MALLKVICWALIFIIRIRFPPGKPRDSGYNKNKQGDEYATVYKRLTTVVEFYKRFDTSSLSILTI